MPSLSNDAISMSTGKRVGRPRSAPNDREERDLRPDEVKAADYVPDTSTTHLGQPCRICGEPSERNAAILRSFNLIVNKCARCTSCWIEGDSGYVYDLKTAGTGLLWRRAVVIFQAKNPLAAPPVSKGDSMQDALHSDWSDPRWETGES